jgi:CRISPR/Cas system CSM-associated protein Csm2 small subunit
LTAGHIEQLRKRREDLDAFIRDLLYDLEQTETDEQAAEVEAEITTTHLATETLDRLFIDYTSATTA